MQFLPEDVKDGRYFPGEQETQILITHLHQYFKHPERSVQRSQVVRTVVSILSPINKHWNHRTVRLWFNNNKRIIYGNQNQPQTEIQDQPPAKRCVQPPRSNSTFPYLPNTDHGQIIGVLPQKNLPVQTQIPATTPIIQAKPDSVAAALLQCRKMVNDNQIPIETKLEACAYLNNSIIRSNDTKWESLSLVLPKSVKETIFDSNSIGNKENPTQIFLPNTVTSFDSVEASFAMNGHTPAVVAYKDSQQFLIVDEAERLIEESPIPASALTYDAEHELFWVSIGSKIQAYNAGDLSESAVLDGDLSAPSSSHASLVCHNGALFYAARSSVFCWTRDAIDNAESAPSVGFTSYLPSITSLAASGDLLVIASADHHAPHVLTANGVVISRLAGHTGGVTALNSETDGYFLSGSADQTARLWDLRCSDAVMRFVRHLGIVTAVASSGPLVFTGGTDCVVRAWDTRAPGHVMWSALGGSSPQSISFTKEGGILSVVSTEKESSRFLDLGRFPVPQVPPDIPDESILTYQIM